MSAITSIEWTDRTWNPVRGCSRVSEGCRNCYAERIAARFSRKDLAFHGFANPGGGWTGRVALLEDALTEPLHWRKPARIFVNSMSDLFHDGLSDQDVDRVFAVMALASHHTFQVLTKRPERMAAYLSGEGVAQRIGDVVQSISFGKPRPVSIKEYPVGPNAEFGYRLFIPWPLPNVWLGVSVENQATLRRIDDLKDTLEAVRFVSLEPLLEDLGAVMLDGIDWAIVGGESGRGARPMEMAWARSLARQCGAQRVALFMKQLGASWASEATTAARAMRAPLLAPLNRKGGEPSEWPEDLRVREFPAVRA